MKKKSIHSLVYKVEDWLFIQKTRRRSIDTDKDCPWYIDQYGLSNQACIQHVDFSPLLTTRKQKPH